MLVGQRRSSFASRPTGSQVTTCDRIDILQTQSCAWCDLINKPFPYSFGVLLTAAVVFTIRSRKNHSAASQLASASLLTAPRRSRHQPRAVTLHALSGRLPVVASASNGARFLGPTGDTSSPETDVPKPCTDDGRPLLWKVNTGSGYATPLIASDTLVYAQPVGDEANVDCGHPGTKLGDWHFHYPTKSVARFHYANRLRYQPLVDRTRIFTYGAESHLHGLELRIDKSPRQHPPTRTCRCLPRATCQLRIKGYRIIATMSGDRQSVVVAHKTTASEIASEFPCRRSWQMSSNASTPVVMGDQIVLFESCGFRGFLIGATPNETCEKPWVDGHCLHPGEYAHQLWVDLSPQACAALYTADATWSVLVVSYVTENRPFDQAKAPPLFWYELREQAAQKP